MPIEQAQRLVADATPAAVGATAAVASWSGWWDILSTGYSAVIGVCTLVYVAARAANEVRKWRSGKVEG